MGFSDTQIMGMKEILTEAVVNATRGRSSAVQDIVQDEEFSKEHGIIDRLESIDEQAAEDLLGRSDDFVRGRVEAGEELLYEPVEVSRIIMQLSHLTYILNDEFSLATCQGAIALWEMILGEAGLPEEYPQEGRDLITELLEESKRIIALMDSPVKMVLLWNERFDEVHAGNGPFGNLEELLEQLRGLGGVGEEEVEEQA